MRKVTYYRERVCASRLAQVIMPAIPDDEADVVAPDEVDGGLDVGDRRGVDRVHDVVPESTRGVRVQERVTAVIGKLVGHG